jgi:hypothetical protein
MDLVIIPIDGLLGEGLAAWSIATTSNVGGQTGFAHISHSASASTFIVIELWSI